MFLLFSHGSGMVIILSLIHIYIIALLIDLILLVLGMIMDMAPIILIATPILLPIATSIGIDPIQFGIIVVLNCGIGLLTPPVGAVLFIGSAVAKRPMEKVVKATLPFYLCMFVALTLAPCRRLCSNKTNVPADLQSAGNEYQDLFNPITSYSVVP